MKKEMIIWRCLAVFVCGALVFLGLEVRRAQTEIAVLRDQVVQVQALNVQIERLVARQQSNRISTPERLDAQPTQAGTRQTDETQSLRSLPKGLTVQQERVFDQVRNDENQATAAQRTDTAPPLQEGQFPPGILGQLLEKTYRKN